MHYVYILYSLHLNRFYVGESDNVDRRLILHKTGYFKGAFTSTADDWVIKLKIECVDKKHSLAVEKAIKKRKSKVCIDNLIQYPDLVKKLVQANIQKVAGSSAENPAEPVTDLAQDH